MNVLTENSIPLDWDLAYVGLKNNWITPVEVAGAASNNQFKKAIDDEIIVLLEVKKDEPISQFISIVERIIKERNSLEVAELDDKNAIQTWQLGFLLSIEKSKKSIKDKLNEIESLWARFDYPVSWEPFIYYLPAKKSDQIGEAAVYQSFRNYIVKEKAKPSL